MHFDIQTICMRNFDSDIFKGQGCGLDAVCLQLENDKNVKKAEDKAWRKQGCSGFGLFVLFSFCPKFSSNQRICPNCNYICPKRKQILKNAKKVEDVAWRQQGCSGFGLYRESGLFSYLAI